MYWYKVEGKATNIRSGRRKVITHFFQEADDETAKTSAFQKLRKAKEKNYRDFAVEILYRVIE